MFRQICEHFGSSVDVSVGEGKAAEYRLKLNTAALTFGNWWDGGHTRRDRAAH